MPDEHKSAESGEKPRLKPVSGIYFDHRGGGFLAVGLCINLAAQTFQLIAKAGREADQIVGGHFAGI